MFGSRQNLKFDLSRVFELKMRRSREPFSTSEERHEDKSTAKVGNGKKIISKTNRQICSSFGSWMFLSEALD